MTTIEGSVVGYDYDYILKNPLIKAVNVLSLIGFPTPDPEELEYMVADEETEENTIPSKMLGEMILSEFLPSDDQELSPEETLELNALKHLIDVLYIQGSLRTGISGLFTQVFTILMQLLKSNVHFASLNSLFDKVLGQLVINYLKVKPSLTYTVKKIDVFLTYDDNYVYCLSECDNYPDRLKIAKYDKEEYVSDCSTGLTFITNGFAMFYDVDLDALPGDDLTENLINLFTPKVKIHPSLDYDIEIDGYASEYGFEDTNNIIIKQLFPTHKEEMDYATGGSGLGSYGFIDFWGLDTIDSTEQNNLGFSLPDNVIITEAKLIMKFPGLVDNRYDSSWYKITGELLPNSGYDLPIIPIVGGEEVTFDPRYYDRTPRNVKLYEKIENEIWDEEGSSSYYDYTWESRSLSEISNLYSADSGYVYLSVKYESGEYIVSSVQNEVYTSPTYIGSRNYSNIDNSIVKINRVTKFTKPNMNISWGCFHKSTKIRMWDGTSKNIEDIKIGDYVVDSHNQKQEVVWNKSYAQNYADYYTKYTLPDGRTLNVIGDERIWWKGKFRYISEIKEIKSERIYELCYPYEIFTTGNDEIYADGILCGKIYSNVKNKFIREILRRTYKFLFLGKYSKTMHKIHDWIGKHIFKHKIYDTTREIVS